MKKNKIDKKTFRQRILENIFKGPAQEYVKKYRLQVVKEIFDDLENDLAHCLLTDYREFVNYILDHREKQLTINALDEIKEDEVVE